MKNRRRQILGRHPERGIMLMEVMGAFAIISVSLVLFALGSIQLSKLFRETYSPSIVEALRVDSLNLDLRRDERGSVAAYSGAGDLTLDGDAFMGVTFPTQNTGADWDSSAPFLADLATFYSQTGHVLAVNPNTLVEQNSWLLFLGPNGRLTAYYRFTNRESLDVDGQVGVDTLVERYVPLDSGATEMTLTQQIAIRAPGQTLALLMGSLGHAYAAEAPATREVYASLPSAFLSGDPLYDRSKLWLEAREVSPRTLTLRPGFQP